MVGKFYGDLRGSPERGLGHSSENRNLGGDAGGATTNVTPMVKNRRGADRLHGEGPPVKGKERFIKPGGRQMQDVFTGITSDQNVLWGGVT